MRRTLGRLYDLLGCVAPILGPVLPSSLLHQRSSELLGRSGRNLDSFHRSTFDPDLSSCLLGQHLSEQHQLAASSFISPDRDRKCILSRPSDERWFVSLVDRSQDCRPCCRTIRDALFFSRLDQPRHTSLQPILVSTHPPY